MAPCQLFSRAASQKSPSEMSSCPSAQGAHVGRAHPCKHQGLETGISIKTITPPSAPALSRALEMFLHLTLPVIMGWLPGEAALAGLLIFLSREGGEAGILRAWWEPHIMPRVGFLFFFFCALHQAGAGMCGMLQCWAAPQTVP